MFLGCPVSFFGSTCNKLCPSNCFEGHCFPSNGTCVYGCNSDLCLDNKCDADGACSIGCPSGKRGKFCDQEGNKNLIYIYPSGYKHEPIFSGSCYSSYCITCSVVLLIVCWSSFICLYPKILF